MRCFDAPPTQITNVCITMNEFPYIRYYLPTHHAPLGAFKPHASTRAPPPPENSGRWRTQLARGAEARAYENADTDFVSKVLAFMVQRDLDEYKKANPDFPVREAFLPNTRLVIELDRRAESVRSTTAALHHDHH